MRTTFSPESASLSSFLISVVLPAPRKPEKISIFVMVSISLWVYVWGYEGTLGTPSQIRETRIVAFGSLRFPIFAPLNPAQRVRGSDPCQEPEVLGTPTSRLAAQAVYWRIDKVWDISPCWQIRAALQGRASCVLLYRSHICLRASVHTDAAHLRSLPDSRGILYTVFREKTRISGEKTK